MESARGEKSNHSNRSSLVGEGEQLLTQSPGSSETRRPQHVGLEQQSIATGLPSHEHARSGAATSMNYFAPSSAIQHQQSTPSQQSIPAMPEEAAAGIQQPPSSRKPNEGCSPDPHSSAPTTGTTTTPNSLASTPGEAAASRPGPGPEFPSESLQSTPSKKALHGPGGGGGAWSLPEGMVTPRYAQAYPSAGEGLLYSLSPNESGQATYPCAIKLLVSNNVAGSIIGRAGQTISDLQVQSSTRIKLSQTGDYFPGSQDRVCLVQGQPENVKVALVLLLERIHMLQEHQHTQQTAWQSNRSESGSFDFVVRLLVPSSCCGMIIGKSGANIRQMEGATGVSSVRLSPKESADPNYPSAAIIAATSERVVTLTGPTLQNCMNCMFIILDGMTAHPDICRYSNMTTSYSRIAVDPFIATSPPLRPTVPQATRLAPGGFSWEASPYLQAQGATMGKRVSSLPDLTGPMLSQRGPGIAIEDVGGPAGHYFGESVQYSLLFGAPDSSYSSHHGQISPRLPQIAGPPMYMNHLMESPSPATVPSSASAPDLLALHFESMHISPDEPRQQGLQAQRQDYSMFAAQLAPPSAPPQAGFSAQVFVPDSMIGSILGRGGRTLSELQVHTGTRIRISQRGEYMPGTRNRIVTIRGPTAQSVSLAQYMMSQRMILPRTATYQEQPSQQQQQQPSMRVAASLLDAQSYRDAGTEIMFQQHPDAFLQMHQHPSSQAPPLAAYGPQPPPRSTPASSEGMDHAAAP